MTIAGLTHRIEDGRGRDYAFGSILSTAERASTSPRSTMATKADIGIVISSSQRRGRLRWRACGWRAPSLARLGKIIGHGIFPFRFRQAAGSRKKSLHTQSGYKLTSRHAFEIGKIDNIGSRHVRGRRGLPRPGRICHPSRLAVASSEPQVVTAQLVDGPAAHQLHVAFDSPRRFSSALSTPA